jgi:hypothetical protein
MQFSRNPSLPLVGSPSEERFRTSRNNKNRTLLLHLSIVASCTLNVQHSTFNVFSLKDSIVLFITKEFAGKASLLRNLPLPLFSKEGYITSLWSASGGEVRRDFIINVSIHTNDLISNFSTFNF